MATGGKILIIGAGGRMGAALARRYALNREVLAWKRADLDVLHPERVRDAVRTQEFSTLIYTAGITSVDYCEEHPEESRLTNTETPGVLAEVCAEKGAKLIHISTDYVFDGQDPAPRKETDETNPICVYGHCKLEGERAVLGASPEFLVIRVSWLFGHDKPAFPDMILQRAMEQEHVEAIADKVSCPTYSEDLAQWIEPMIDESRYHGLLHLCNRGSSSWQSYGQTTLDIAAKLGLPLKARHVDGISRASLTSFKAQRPEYTAFDTTRYEQLSGSTTRPWQEALEEYLQRQYVAK
ncbi:MAG: dTDP-4-dehydrorhamnose reductase [Roseimicrobium sp.]